MPATLTIRDELVGKDNHREWTLQVPSEELTVRELLRERIYQEVQDHNLRERQTFRGLVRPEGAQEASDGWRLELPRPIDWKKQWDLAVEAFESNRILILIQDRQAESLEQKFRVEPSTKVTFLRLMPLVGG